jgi:hypothetical protein
MEVVSIITKSSARNLGLKKAALIHSDSGYGMSGKEQFESIAPKLGFSIAAMESSGIKTAI